MSGRDIFRFCVVTFVIAPSLVGADLALPKWGGSDPEKSGGKRVKREFRVIPPRKPKIDLSFGTAFFYDSNPRLVPNGSSTGVATANLGFNLKMGSEIEQGSFYEFDYAMSAFKYTDSSLQPPGGNNLDHRIHAKMGLNRARTKFRLNSSYSRNSGHVVDFDGLNRESRMAESDDFAIDFLIARTLPHGSLEARVGSYLHSFRDSTLNDGSGYFTDLVWYYAPGFAPKTNLGVGFRFGSDNYDGFTRQRYHTPSLRWRYRVSGKTTLFSSVGYETRQIDSRTNLSSKRLVYSGGFAWAPSPKTSFELSLGRNVSPSYNRGSGNYEASEAVMKIHKRLGRKFVLTGSAGIEDADYFSASTAQLSARNDTFFKSGVNLMHPLQVGEKLKGEVNVFYNYNKNDSSINAFDFEQHVTGVRFGFKF